MGVMWCLQVSPVYSRAHCLGVLLPLGEVLRQQSVCVCVCARTLQDGFSAGAEHLALHFVPLLRQISHTHSRLHFRQGWLHTQHIKLYTYTLH